jgi:uncharacterized radical SAM protein YgiQ
MYGTGCGAADGGALCKRQSCLHPAICSQLKTDDKSAVELLRAVHNQQFVRHVTVTSGIRYDMLLHQPRYFKELVVNHVGGLLKVAPEHCSKKILALMRKPESNVFEEFLDRFRHESAMQGKRHGIVPYLMSGHPGTTLSDMVDLALFLNRNRLRVEQVQQFTPTPGTLATCIYYTGINPFSGDSVYVARSDREKRMQKTVLLAHIPEERRKIMEALCACNREDVAEIILGRQAAADTGRINQKSDKHGSDGRRKNALIKKNRK